MIILKNLTIKNFQSIGNATQAINLNHPGLTLILGNNLDLGGEGSRNGTGKTTLLNALSFCLFGDALTNIKRDNLINKTNQKHMSVSCEFEVDGKTYKIERGRKPNYFRFFCDDEVVNEKDTDEAQGENRLTQEEIHKVFGMSLALFKQIVALNTYNLPFLSMKANEQRDVIEELLGITRLSTKAQLLKDQITQSKNDIKEEELRIQAVKSSNEKIEETIRRFKIKSTAWVDEQSKKVTTITNAIKELENINVDQEIENHKSLDKWKESSAAINEATKWLESITRDTEKQNRLIEKLNKEIQSLEAHQCYACGQEIHDSKQEEILDNKKEQKQEATQQILSNDTQHQEHTKTLESIGTLGEKPQCFYLDVDQAYQHRQNLENLKNELVLISEQENPHIEQIDTLQNQNIEKIEYDLLNNLTKLKEHQEFLYRLLTSKDSFIRKKIIDQNLVYLNSRLNHYLELLYLPHEVIFKSDLSVEITELGRELDFDNLSRGERNRLILGLSWAFRDIFESTSKPINLMFIDELIDSGMDTQGVESSMSILKKMTRERDKNIFLISHKDELTGRVNSIMNVVKENGFTSISEDLEVVSTH
jgi:DNA repair exonuclease SbcCD ATPase subunit